MRRAVCSSPALLTAVGGRIIKRTAGAKSGKTPFPGGSIMHVPFSKIALTLGALLSLTATLNAAPTVLIEDHFTRAVDGNLNGTLPDTVGADAWTVNSGSFATSSGQALTPGASDASLPLAVESGKEYRLSVDLMVDPDSGSGEWIRLGYSTNSGILWAFVRRVNGDNQFRIDQSSGDNPATIGSANTLFSPGTFNALELVLDTHPANWTLQAYLNGTAMRGTPYVFTTNPTVTGVFIGGDQPAGVFDNLLVTAPEPASLGMLGLAGLAVLGRRRR
jgi:hypothetical protein